MKTYLVGGAVRDKLLKLAVHDRDWVVVGASPQQLLDKGFIQAGRDFPVFLHPVTHEEYALARTERKQGHGHQGFAVDFSPEITLEQDLQRRDLTINAMAEDNEGQLIDPWHGQQDLQAKVLRHISPAFAEDPLRVLRVARFAARFARLNFTIAPTTLQLMTALADKQELSYLTAERVWKETEKALTTHSPDVYFRVLQQCKALGWIFPELAQCFPEQSTGEGVQPNFGEQSLLALKSASQLAADPMLRFAALLHLVGRTDAADSQDPLSCNQTARAIQGIQQLSQRLRLPNQYRDLALMVVQYRPSVDHLDTLSAHQRVALLDNLDAFRRPARIEQLATVCQAIASAQGKPYPQAEELRQIYQVAQQVLVAPIVKAGFKGAEVKAELHRQRISAVQKLG